MSSSSGPRRAALPPPCGHGAGLAPPRELRCDCGSLLARLVPDGVELKCRRCKQTWTVPIEKAEAR